MPSAQLVLALDESFAPALPVPPHTRHLCAACQSRPARFQYRGAVKADRSHTLCFQCYRAALDSVRTIRLQAVRATLAKAADAQPARDATFIDRPGVAARAAAEEAEERDERLSLRRRRAQIAARHALDW
jgi:hypothetical protein